MRNIIIEKEKDISFLPSTNQVKIYSMYFSMFTLFYLQFL